ncbi:MAG: phosphate ABC transporter substrate-binding protein PstS [Undibacterium sp.]|nr:phosphate ABC transporter substrate-binding protein PstS [Undibacterium sp.]
MQINRVIKSVMLAASAFLAISAAHAGEVTGAGASFPYPVYNQWATAYKNATGNSVNYQSIGSGGGIKQIKAKTVDFGASDMPLKLEELDADGLMQFPTVIGGVVPVINVDGVAPGQLKLTGEVIAKIYLGTITKWNAPEIVALNAGVKLPADDITVMYRSDGSGTTFIWTDYLSKVNAEFKEKISSGTAVKWPVGLGGKGNDGVAANVQRIKGAIGYVEYAYVKKNKMTHAQLKNRDGFYVQPDDLNFKAAAAGADWAKTPGMGVNLNNQGGKDTWPISSTTFILMHKVPANPENAKQVIKFFEWAYVSGGQMATDLEYVPLPNDVIKVIHASWKANLKDAAGKALY